MKVKVKPKQKCDYNRAPLPKLRFACYENVKDQKRYFDVKDGMSDKVRPQKLICFLINFQKLHEVWKGFFNAGNLRATATFLLNSFRSYGSTKAEEIMISCYF